MAQRKPIVIDGDVIDAVGELTNMVAGRAKAALEHLAMSLALPTVITGKNHVISFGSATQTLAMSRPKVRRIIVHGALRPGVFAKDVILHILETFAVREDTLDRVMEFGGPGLAGLSMDERATLCNMATECTARSGICEGDALAARWLAALDAHGYVTLAPAALAHRLLGQERDDGGGHDA